MSTSTLKFYKNTPILPNKNFMVDEIESYLGQNYVEPTNLFSITEFQYIKHSLNLEIKIDSEQTNLEFLLANGWNYMSIKNSDTGAKNVYYFIIAKEWRAQNTIRMTLYMDTLNTFKYGTDYILSDKTKVMREHKDRFEKFEYDQWEEVDNFRVLLNPNSSTAVSGGRICTQFVTYYLTGYSLDPANWHIQLRSNSEGIYVKLQSVTFATNGLTIVYFINKTSIPLGENYLQIAMEYKATEKAELPFLIRKVDYFNEGLNPILYKIKEEEIQENTEYTTSWNLVYKGSSSVECYCVPEEPTKSKQYNSSTDLVKNYTDLIEGYWYFFQYGYNDGEIVTDLIKYPSNIIIEADGKQYSPEGTATFGWSEIRVGYAFRRATGQTSLTLYQVKQQKNRFSGDWDTVSTVIVTTNIPSVVIKNSPSEVNFWWGTTLPNEYTEWTDSWTLVPGTFDIKTLYGIDQIDRTDSTLIKIIKSPYAPCDYSYDDINGVHLDSSHWTYNDSYNAYKLTSNLGNLSHEIKSEVNTFFADLLIPYYDLPSSPYTQLRDIKYESKLYHSSFFQSKFVYDSFSFTFQNEKIDVKDSYLAYIDNHDGEIIPYATCIPLTFIFTITKTINSKFLFDFPYYKLNMSEEDYDHVLPVARNNEEVIYNSQYITYLRTGYNYDVKAKERTEKLAGIQFGLQTGVGAIQSIVTTAFHPVAGALSMGGTFASTITGITQLVNTIAQAEDSVNRKISSARAQAISVAGSDDVDLLVRYSNNKAKLCTYQVSDRVKGMLFDLFYYTGYATGEMKVPNLTTRTWFNFIQADIVIKENKANIPQNLLDNIAERFTAGITNLHRLTIGIYRWDFEQTLENWETWLIPLMNS